MGPCNLQVFAVSYHTGIDIGRRRVILKNKSVRLHDAKGSQLFSKVVASKTVHIPPGRENIIQRLVYSRREKVTTTTFLEPAFCIFRK